MATLEVNKNSMYFDSKDYLNLKSLLPKLQKEFPIDLYTLGYFLINGRPVDINSEDPSLIRPISDEDLIQINFDEKKTFMSDIIFETHELANKIIKQVLHTSELLQNGENDKDLSKITITIQAVDTFIQSISFIMKNIKDTESNFHSLPFKQLHIHLLSVMKAINTAQNTQDYIMLADLLEYELKDNLTQWKILIMPTLRKQTQIRL
jgi:stress response protein SCP2